MTDELDFHLWRPHPWHGLSAGRNPPLEVRAFIEITPFDLVKYEVDKETGAMFVDRFMATAMHYPCNYGYVPHTLSDDGDPCDVLVVTPYPLIPGSVIEVRPLGVLNMEDESGMDAKVLAVPKDKLTRRYRAMETFRDLPHDILERIAHFFEH